MAAHIHTLADYRDAIGQFTTYPEAGTGSHRARRHVTLGVYGKMIGAVSQVYQTAEHDDAGVFTEGRLFDLKRQMGDSLWYITRAIIEHGTRCAGLIWGRSLADLLPSGHVELNTIEAWVSSPRTVVLTDFTDFQDVLALLHTLAFAAARHGWTLQDLAWANVAKLTEHAGGHVLQGAGALVAS
ncbi:hypothetical protein [Paenarthrobacter sp. PH39-S1]|uniref:hypothetical protein n=1 Tax=Paenarthrobacter sp. PH39-S1 TaxID=3046204 RepID=UPI0024BA9F5C|nr:hypothetical protein [Paenarthrobacter sp. PH39-S1]MDJ0358474.1 hypothetical protein [Paenarthrobacter sp. PH39-S1]